MPITIARTPWIDDDGTGQTGTVLNNAMKMGLYDEVDAALAQCVAVDAGGYLTRDLLWTPDATYDIGKSLANRPRDVFCSRDLTAGGRLSVSGMGAHSFIAGGTGGVTLSIRNVQGGSGNYAGVEIGNDTQAVMGWLYGMATTWPTSGYYTSDGVTLASQGGGGLNIGAGHASGAIRFYAGGAFKRWEINEAGALSAGTNAAGYAFAYLYPGVVVIGNVGEASNNSMQFQNSHGTVGTITTSGLTTAFNTSSDRRLKTDKGLASDLTALRLVVVHDYIWSATGAVDRGVFAQDAASCFPRAITIGSDGDDLSKPWMTDYSKFVPDLIVGWQDHDRRLAQLETLLTERTAA